MLSTIHDQVVRLQHRCGECGDDTFVLDQDRGEVVCTGCGLVLTDVLLNRKPEWRAFTLQEQVARRRVGSPTAFLKFDKGLTTTFRPSERRLPFKTRLKMRRLRRWNLRARLHTTVERNLSQAMNELRRLADRLNIPRNIQETAALLYRKALRRGLVRGRSIAAVVAASLYAACRLSGTPRTLKSVVNTSHRERREITRCYRLLLQHTNQTMPIDGPAKYIPKLASTLYLNQTVQNRAVEIVRDAKQQRLTVGKGPVGIAAAAIYLAAHLHGVDLTQRELATASQVTEVTIRNLYQGLLEGLDHLPNPFPERAAH